MPALDHSQGRKVNKSMSTNRMKNIMKSDSRVPYVGVKVELEFSDVTLEYRRGKKMRKRKRFQKALKNRWVVLLLDPDWNDTSPWSVVAPNASSAVALAKAEWRDWAYEENETPEDEKEEPEVIKIYKNSWITERYDDVVWCVK